MSRILLSLALVLLPLLFALPALAGNWGEDWGTMTWGAAIAAVPTMGKLGLLVLVLVLGLGGLAARAIKRSRAAACLLVIGLVLPMLSPAVNAQTVSVPNTLTNGSLSDAAEMNENFEALRAAVNTGLTTYPAYDCFRGGFCGADGFDAGFYASDTGASSGCGTDPSTQSGSLWVGGANSSQAIQSIVPGPYLLPPCEEDPATTADVTGLTQFQNDTPANADQVNANFLTLKAGVETCLASAASGGNQEVCESVGGTWDAGSCTAAPCDVTSNDAAVAAAAAAAVDITTDNAALCTNANGAYDPATNTCTVDITTDNGAAFNDGVASVDITSDNQTVCEGAGGIWQDGTCVAGGSLDGVGFAAESCPASYTIHDELHIESIRGCTTFDSLKITNMGVYQPVSLQYLDFLESVGDLRIEFADLSTFDFDGGLDSLDSLTSVGSIALYEVSGVTNLSAFQNLTSLGGDLTIRGINGLVSLSGLENIEVISGDVEIYDNQNLPDSALSALGETDIQGSCSYRPWFGLTRPCF